MKNRTCGGCTACCLTHEIYEIKKPAGKLCPHCIPGVGCKNYDHRPKDCSKFRCDWLMCCTDEQYYRPDRIGVVLDSYTGTPQNKILFKKILYIREARAGALNTPAIWEITMEALDHRICVLQLHLSGKKVLFLPAGANLSEKARRLIAKEGFEITPYPILMAPVNGGQHSCPEIR